MIEKMNASNDLDFTLKPGQEIIPEQVEENEGGVNIDSALRVLNDAEMARAGGTEVDMEEVNEKINNLQELQNSGINDLAIQTTLTRLIAIRG